LVQLPDVNQTSMQVPFCLVVDKTVWPWAWARHCRPFFNRNTI